MPVPLTPAARRLLMPVMIPLLFASGWRTGVWDSDLFPLTGGSSTSGEVDAATGTTPEILPLDGLETVSVLLFEQDRPRDIRLSIYSGSSVLVAGERRLVLDSLTVPVRIRSGVSGLRVSVGGVDIGVAEVRIDPIGRSVIRVEGVGETYRYYSGTHRIRATNGGSLRWMHTTDIESYIGGVVASEMGFDHPEALKAQAVASRTYLLWAMKKNEALEHDILDHQMNQVFKGVIPYKEIFQQAAVDTRSEILTWDGRLIQSTFFSTCGGLTNSNEQIWPQGDPLPFLRSVDDNNACSIAPFFTWQSELPRRDLYTYLGQSLRAHIRSLVFIRDERGRVQKVRASTSAPGSVNVSAGVVRDLSGTEFRQLVNDRFGMGAVRSTWIEWDEQEDTILIKGRGFGHGVGLCQWGSLGLARAGWVYSDILGFYFGGAEIVTFDTIEEKQIALYD